MQVEFISEVLQSRGYSSMRVNHYSRDIDELEILFESSAGGPYENSTFIIVFSDVYSASFTISADCDDWRLSISNTCDLELAQEGYATFKLLGNGSISHENQIVAKAVRYYDGNRDRRQG